jgi:hypothetical protein
MIADSRRFTHYVSRMAEGAIKAGLAVFTVPGGGQPWSDHGGDPGTVYQSPSPAAAAAATAFITSITSSTGVQSFTGASLNGAVGGTVMYPERKVSLILSNHADWDATTAVLSGELNGVAKTENLTIPNGGNSTVTSTGYFDKVTGLSIPAQSGTGGTATLGVAILDSSVTIADFEGFAVWDPTLIPNTIPSQDQTAEYHDKDTLSVMLKGAFWGVAETPASALYKGDVYVRVAGTGTFGAIRHDSDSGNAIQITGARFGCDANTTTGLVKVEMY